MRRRQEFVIGGWQPSEGGRTGRLGSLLVGYHDAAGVLRYAGRVGTGFSGSELRHLDRLLATRETSEPPFTPPPPPTVARTAHWVHPDLVAEVTFGE